MIDKLAQITPFDQVNNGNTCANIAIHIEENSEEWYQYIYADRITTVDEKQDLENKIKVKKDLMMRTEDYDRNSTDSEAP